MRKIIFLLAFSLIGDLYGDSVTSGSLGLLLPSTGVVDSNRSWADKINTNFEIIDSTVSGTLGLADNMGSHIATQTLDMASFGITNSSSIVVQDTMTATSIFFDSASVVYRIEWADGSVQTSSPPIIVTNIGDNLGSHIATQTLNAGGFAIANSSSAVFRDTMTATSLFYSSASGVYRIEWADGTVQVSSPIDTQGSGGGSNLGQREYDVWVGSSNANADEWDIRGDDLTTWKDVMQLCNTGGMTSDSSTTCKIALGNNLWDLSGATLPAGVQVDIVGSSVVLRPTGTDTGIFTIYGKIRGRLYADMQNRAMASTIFDIRSGADVDRLVISGADNSNQSAATRYNIFRVSDSSNVRLTAEILDFAGAEQDQFAGGVLTVRRSSDSFINFPVLKGGNNATTGKQTIMLTGTRNFHITGADMEVGARFISYFGAGNGYILEDSNILINEAYDANGVIFNQVNGAFDTDVGTGTIIRNNNFTHDVGDTDEIIGIQANANILQGVLIKDNYVICRNSSKPNSFVTIAAAQFGTVIRDNTNHCPTLLSDSGVATLQINNVTSNLED